MNFLLKTLERRHSINQSIFHYLLAILAFSIPYSFAYTNSLIVFRIIFIALILNWLVDGNPLNKFKIIKHNYLLLSLIFFCCLHLVGMLYTANTSHGLYQLDKKTPLFILTLIVATSPRLTHVQLKTILISFVASILLASFICFGYAIHRNNYLETFYYPNWFYFSYNDLTEIIKIQPNYLAIFVCFSILILIWLLVENGIHYRIFKKAVVIFTVLYLIIFLLLLSGRTSILALSSIVLVGIIYHFYKKRKFIEGISIIILLFVCLIIAIYQIPIIKERFIQTLGIQQQNVWINQYGDGKGGLPSVRLLKWQCAWSIIKDNILFGVGTGDVQDSLQGQYKKINFDIAFNAEFNAHNQYLQTWIGLGLTGFASLLSCVILSIILSYKQKNYLYLSFIFLFFICCITESTFERQFGIVFFGLFNSLFAFHSLTE